VVFIPSLSQFDVHSYRVRFRIKLMVYDNHEQVITDNTQIENRPDENVGAIYRSSRAISVFAGRRTFRGFPPLQSSKYTRPYRRLSIPNFSRSLHKVYIIDFFLFLVRNGFLRAMCT
jgi:hypothetical protein